MFDKPMRNHFSIIFEQLGAFGLVLVTGGFSLFYELWQELGGDFSRLFDASAGGADVGFVLLMLAVILLLLFRAVFAWYKTVFYFDGDYLVYERKTLMRKSSRLPFSAISTVNLERNVFERLIGTAKIKLDINSSVTANETDFTFVLPLGKAEMLKKALSEFKSSEETARQEPERNLICAFSRLDALRHVAFSMPWVQLLGTLVVVLPPIIAEGGGFGEAFAALGLFAAAWIFGLVMKFFAACNFRVECDEKSIYLSSGLLKKKQYAFERAKINALIVRRPLLARLAGLYSAEVAVVGFGNDKEETPQISLLVKKQELEKILEACAPEFKCSAKRQRAHKVGLAWSMLSAAVCAAPFAAFFGLTVSPLLSVLIFLLGILLAFLGHKTKSLAADGEIFSYSKGILSQKTGFFKYRDIQTASFKSNAILSRFGVGRIKISILSSISQSTHTTGFFEKKSFEEIKERMLIFF